MTPSHVLEGLVSRPMTLRTSSRCLFQNEDNQNIANISESPLHVFGDNELEAQGKRNRCVMRADKHASLGKIHMDLSIN